MYYVFAGDTYYPQGGGKDLRGHSEDFNEAVAMAINSITGGCDWSEVYGADDVNGLVLEWSNK